MLRRGIRPHVQLYSRSDQLAHALSHVEQVAARTWQRNLGGGFQTSPIELAFYRVALSRDAFRAWVLYDGDTPIAFNLGTIYRGSFAARYMAFDPDYASCSPGTYLFSHLVRELCEDESIRYVDLGVGDNQFKQVFAEESWIESDVVLFGTGIEALRVNAVRSGARAISNLGKTAVSRSALLGQIWTRREKALTRP